MLHSLYNNVAIEQWEILTTLQHCDYSTTELGLYYYKYACMHTYNYMFSSCSIKLQV